MSPHPMERTAESANFCMAFTEESRPVITGAAVSFVSSPQAGQCQGSGGA